MDQPNRNYDQQPGLYNQQSGQVQPPQGYGHVQQRQNYRDAQAQEASDMIVSCFN